MSVDRSNFCVEADPETGEVVTKTRYKDEEAYVEAIDRTYYSNRTLDLLGGVTTTGFGLGYMFKGVQRVVQVLESSGVEYLKSNPVDTLGDATVGLILTGVGIGVLSQIRSNNQMAQKLLDHLADAKGKIQS